MTHAQAHNLLDQVREGADRSETQILLALELTGDLSADQLAKAIQEVRK